MPKLWKLKEKIPQTAAENLSDYPAFLAQLLFNRGLADKDKIESFLNPDYKKLNDPFLFLDMQKAVDRIWRAIEQGEKICIYGDYDADAVTANAVLQQTFRYLGAEVSSYIPDRFSEGYGVNIEALEKIKLSGAKIIITVDCGTNSHDAAEFCKNNGIDLIITDHHEIIDSAPKSLALINPKNKLDNYPYTEITGVGVAFKLAAAILKDPKTKLRIPNHIDGWEKWLLDLVSIGTVADCHTLIGENRTLVKFGLKVLAKSKWAGLTALMGSAGLAQQDHTQNDRVTLLRAPDAYTLGFVIAPRLNAAGRLEHADVALDLLLEKDAEESKKKALRLEEVNKRRQDLTKNVLSEAKEKIINIQHRKVLALVGEGWPKGVMGLVAGRLAEEHYKPVIVLEQTAEICTGSARTAGEFNLIEALKFSSEHLVKFGGHKQAAGLTLQKSSFEFFYQKVLEYAEKEIQEEASPVLEMEAEIFEEDLNLETLKYLNMLEPFGVGNPKPKFLLSNVQILSQKQVGSEKQHLQLQLKVGQKTVSAVAFNFRPIEYNKVDIACELMEDNFQDRHNLKLRVVDIKNNA